jgi:hypothetical protein
MDTVSATAAAVDAAGDLYLVGSARTTGQPSRWFAARISATGTVRWSAVGPQASDHEYGLGMAPDGAGGAAVLARVGNGYNIAVTGIDANGAAAWSFSEAWYGDGIVAWGGSFVVLGRTSSGQAGISKRSGPTESWRVVYDDPTFGYAIPVVGRVGALGHLYVGVKVADYLEQGSTRVLELDASGALVQTYHDDPDGWMIDLDASTPGRPVVLGIPYSSPSTPPPYVRALGANGTDRVVVPVGFYGSAFLAPRPGGGIVVAGTMPYDIYGDHDTGAVTIALDAALATSWSARYDRAGAGADYAAAVAVDAAGSSRVLGTSWSAAGDRDVVLARWDHAGNHVWTRRWALPGDQVARSAWVAPAGDGALLAMEGVSSVYTTIVVRFDADGWELWSRRLGGWASGLVPGSGGRFHVPVVGSLPSSEQYRTAIVTLSPDGEESSRTVLPFECTSYTQAAPHPGGGLLWAGTTGNGCGNVRDLAAARLADDGVVVWTTTHKVGPQGPQGSQVSLSSTFAVDAAGDLYVAGNTWDLATYEIDGFVLKLDGASGAVAWADVFGNPGTTELGAGVATHPDGGIVAVALDEDPVALVREIVVTRYAADGTALWTSRRAPGGYPQYAISLAVDPRGHTYVAAEMMTLESAYDWVVFELDENGAAAWEARSGATDRQFERTPVLALDPWNGLVVAGAGTRPGTGTDLLVARWATPPAIEVAPLAVSFGDVAIGDAARAVITVADVGGLDLDVSQVSLGAGSDPAFSIVGTGGLPGTVPPGGVADVTVELRPTAEGAVSASLVVASADAARPSITVSIAGSGVLAATPPQRVQAILDQFDAAVAAGTLGGSGPGGSARGRLGALRNMLEAVGSFVASGNTQGACGQLAVVLDRIDGSPRPPDFASGPSAASIRGSILTLRSSLGCP